MTITLHIRRSTGVTFDVRIDRNETVRVVKERIASLHEDLPADCQRLIYKGRILDNSKDLVSYGILPDSTLHLVKGKPDGTGTTLTGTAATTVIHPNTTTPTEPARPASTTHATMNTTANSTTMAPMPDFNTLQRDLQQNPERIAEMMNSPVMQSIMDSPDDVLRSIMNMNPQMRDLMEQNPQLREVLNDPQLMRQSLQMMRDPQAMQTAMRNQELAMSQIENMPGGFAALSSMYHNVQEPMMDAMSNNQPSTQTPTVNTAAANQQAGAVGAAMPNPWGAPPRASTTSRTPSLPPFAVNPWNTMAPPIPWQQQPPQTALQPQQLEQTLAMLESNPMMQQMMEQMFSDPAVMQQMMQSNPMLQQMMVQDPHMAQMLSDPQFMRSMMNPTTLRSMVQLQSSMNSNGRMPPLPPPAGLDFSNLLQQMQSTNLNAPPTFGAIPSSFGTMPFSPFGTMPPPQIPIQHPADRYRRQLQSLRDMGFDDEALNLRALETHHGNVNRAVDMMINESFSAPLVPPVVTETPVQTATSQDETTTDEPKDSTDKKND